MEDFPKYWCDGAISVCGTTLWTATVCDLSGDEPHYLLMAYSLIHDGDLDLDEQLCQQGL